MSVCVRARPRAQGRRVRGGARPHGAAPGGQRGELLRRGEGTIYIIFYCVVLICFVLYCIILCNTARHLVGNGVNCCAVVRRGHACII